MGCYNGVHRRSYIAHLTFIRHYFDATSPVSDRIALAAGRWLPAVRDLVSGLRDTLGLEAYLLALLDARFEMGLSGQPARLIGRCRMVSVDEWLISGVRG